MHVPINISPAAALFITPGTMPESKPKEKFTGNWASKAVLKWCNLGSLF